MSKSKSRRAASTARPPAWLGLGLMAGGLLVVGLVAWLAWPRPANPATAIEVRGAPKLRVNAEVVDLGAVRLGKWVSATFTLTNVGDQPLRFSGDPFIEVVEGC